MQDSDAASQASTDVPGFLRRPQASHGIMPWIFVDQNWYFLAQAGYSAAKHDLKVDPLRGQPKEDETPVATAIRECKEESGISRLLAILRLHVILAVLNAALLWNLHAPTVT